MTINPTTVEFDSKRITSLLGNTNEAKDFAKGIQSVLAFEIQRQRHLVNHPKTASEQYNILTEIVDKCDALLKVLKPIGLKDKSYCKYVDFETANLIQYYRWQITRKNRIARDLQSNDEKFLDLPKISADLQKIKATLSPDVNIYTVPQITHEEPDNSDSDLDYPNQVFYSILELKEITTCAAQNVKPGKGNSSKRNPESIRKKNLAIDFVRLYLDCFKTLPPLTANGPAHQAFEYCLYFAKFPEEVNTFNSFKEAIRAVKPEAETKAIIHFLTEGQSKT